MPCPPLDAPAVNIPAAKDEPQRHQGVRRLAAACYDVNLAPARLIQPSSAWQGAACCDARVSPARCGWFSICRGGSQTRPAAPHPVVSVSSAVLRALCVKSFFRPLLSLRPLRLRGRLSLARVSLPLAPYSFSPPRIHIFPAYKKFAHTRSCKKRRNDTCAHHSRTSRRSC